MADPIDFYFDFSSPYGYFASFQIDDLAARHGREVVWRPYLLGAAFQSTGMKPPNQQPLRGDYAMHDFPRCARYYGVPFQMPDPFPIAGVVPSRAFYFAESGGQEAAKGVARALYRGYFAEGRNITDPETVADIAAGEGLERDAVLAGLQDQAVKDRLRHETENALSRGVFGSPFIFVDGEAFWGCDRLPMVEKWLASGGF